ncbi:MFS transporter (plasmid) [Klebsiella michiganensis]|uniref:MFS transporter n=1 Tax=Klebsiella michiganensis TaxID=1134687 RepID=UPI002658C312|nr:MFS transporter [Klebsiella michiganensis]WKJ95763.1 MFS transporter [Klebsiella michiganensis]WKK00973.1 MFS transporter [Klebsiella michiganensis]WKK02891.1 MFS transporter [Klebsiella michiganensis]WKK06988.1 MFS transporter [Klebsiella michiganensis]
MRYIPGRIPVILAVSNLFFTCAVSVDLTIATLVGYQLAPSDELATVPFALITVAGAFSSLFAAGMIGRGNEKLAFILGSLCGTAGGLLSFLAVLKGSFLLFCTGCFLVGVYQAFSQYYRLVAADHSPPEVKGQSISLVMIGGVVAAILGPLLTIVARDIPGLPRFAGVYLVVAGLGILSAINLALFLDRSKSYSPSPDTRAAPGVSPTSRELMNRPDYRTAWFHLVAGSFVMLFLMTAAPLSVTHHHSMNDGAMVIQLHLLGMYVPSLFTGLLIRKVGLTVLLYAGIVLNLTAIAVNLTGETMLAYSLSLLLVGVGWNFMFVGGSTLLSLSYRDNERKKAQGLAETSRFVFSAIATSGAGVMLALLGWKLLGLMMIPVLLVCLASTWQYSRAIRKERTGTSRPAADGSSTR